MLVLENESDNKKRLAEDRKMVEMQKQEISRRFQEEWEVNRKRFFQTLTWNSENWPKMIACKEIYRILGKILLNRLEVLSVQSNSIAEYLTLKVNQSSQYCKAINPSPNTNFESLFDFYKNISQTQCKMLEIIKNEEENIKENLEKFSHFVQENLIQELKKMQTEIEEMRREQKKALFSYIMVLRVLHRIDMQSTGGGCQKCNKQIYDFIR